MHVDTNLNMLNEIDFGFTPSPYQEKIFDFIIHGNGNAVISAKAGSGKTSTCVTAIKLIKPKNKVMFLAFNKSIAEELSQKLKDYPNVEVRTSHGLGFAIIRKNVEGEVELDEFKYRRYVKSNISELTTIDVTLTKNQLYNYIESICALVDFARFNLAQTAEEVKSLAVKFDVPIFFDECDVVIKVLEWGKTELNSIDYTDMVWLPVELSMTARAFQKDFIFIDECQDQSLMSIELFLKCFKRGTRFIAMGDEDQCINTFCGSSEEAFQYMKDYPKTTQFDLPICYRCPKTVVELAKTLVPDIKCREDAPKGDIIEKCWTSSLQSGDMVLCRSKAPLLKVYTKLLRKGIQCHIKGQDIGTNLKKLIEEVDIEELNTNLKSDGVFVRLYDNLFEIRNKLMESKGLDYQDATLTNYITNSYDMIKALTVLAENYTTKTELLSHIDEIFDETREGVILSTIHKAKGLEADNVYILCNSSMPSSLAKKEWEKNAEQNLIYVAYTRAKKKLGFISEEEIKPFGISQGEDKILNELSLIENLVCRVLGKTPVEQKECIEIARFNLNNGFTKIENNHKDDNHKIINNATNNNDNELLSELDILLNL